MAAHAEFTLTANKKFEEIGFDKVMAKFSQLHMLKIVIVDKLQIDRADAADAIRNTCPNIEELDLSRNRFEKLDDVARLCAALPKLRALRLSGNRFGCLAVSDAGAFTHVRTLELANVLLPWPQLGALLSLFPNLTSLVAPNNNISSIPSPAPLPPKLETLDLSHNTFSAFAAIAAALLALFVLGEPISEIGRASCRERV